STSILADELLVSDENRENSSVLMDELLAGDENEESSSILAGDDITENNENIEYYERESLNYSNLWN
ncbi:1018_t:CDS:1, partial [Ambispora leptoticha]